MLIFSNHYCLCFVLFEIISYLLFETKTFKTLFIWCYFKTPNIINTLLFSISTVYVNYFLKNNYFNKRFIYLLIGSSGEESDSSREIPSNLDISRALQVIPLSPNSDFYCSRDNSDKRVRL